MACSPSAPASPAASSSGSLVGKRLSGPADIVITLGTPPFRLDRSKGCFSDWECSIGDERFYLHRIVLADECRGSRFFEAAFNKEYDASSTNLTNLLPESCCRHMPAVFDYMYGQDISLAADNLVELYKIADVLQMQALQQIAGSALVEYDGQATHQLFERSMELQLPDYITKHLAAKLPEDRVDSTCQLFKRGIELGWHVDILETLASKVVSRGVSEILSILALVPHWSGMQRMMALLAELSRKEQGSFQQMMVGKIGSAPQAVSRTLSWDGHLNLRFSQSQVWQCRPAIKLSGISACSVRVATATGIGPAIGLSQGGATLAAPSEDYSFANVPHTWALNLCTGNLWSEGQRVYQFGRGNNFFRDKVVRMELNMDDEELRFICERDGAVFGTISARFRDTGPLFWTLCACSSGTEYQLLDPCPHRCC